MIKQLLRSAAIALMCGITATSAYAEQAEEGAYMPMFGEGRGWFTIEYYNFQAGPNVQKSDFARITKEINVGGIDCWQCNQLHVTDTWFTYNDSYECFEKDRAVYYIGENEDGSVFPYKVMDFNLKAGDRIDWGDYYEFNAGIENAIHEYMMVLSEDSIMVRDRKYRRLIIGYESGQEVMRWVEGVGSNFDAEMALYPSDTAWPTIASVYFTFHHDYIYFTFEDFYAEPITTSSLKSVKAPVWKEDVIYNLQGQRITNPRKGEIVIKNGKKRLIN